MDPFVAFQDAIRAAISVSAISYALAAIGLNIQWGFAGLLNFGHVGSMLVGAYGTAVAVNEGVPFPLAVLVGVLAAVVLGLLLGLPTLRLRAEYLAIVTIAVSEILRIVVRSRITSDYTGGTAGLGGFGDAFFGWNPIPEGRYGFGNVNFNERTVWLMLVGWSLVALFTVFAWLLKRSPWGRSTLALRDDEEAARALGINTFVLKLQCLVLGGVLGAFAGLVLVLDSNYVDPSYWRSDVTFLVYAALIIGGVGRVFAPVVGAIVLWFVIQFSDSLLRQAVDAEIITFLSGSDVGLTRFVLVGLTLMALMIFRPQGIFGSREDVVLDERR